MLNIIVVLFISLILSSAIVLYFLPKIMLLSLKNKILDKIDNRKVHTTAACRLGGASFMPAIVISTIIGYVLFDAVKTNGVDMTLSIGALLIVCAMMVLYFVGVYDDIVGMRYKEKFIYQFTTALLVVYSGTYISSFNGLFGIGDINPYVGMAISIVLVSYITNAINLIDGIDGLASMLSIMAFMMYSIMFYFNKDYIDCLFCLSALGALIPFWHHNVFGLRKGISSKIFMGDGGALVIGFLLSVMAIKLWNSRLFEGEQFNYISEYSWVIAFTMLIIPCFDVIRVMMLRAKKRKPLFLPDKNHFHHKLMSLGLSPRKSLLTLFFTNMLFLSVNYILAIQHVSITFIAIFDIVLWLIMHVVLSRFTIEEEVTDNKQATL